MNILRSLKSLGPGLLFAGAAIGVSHLVQSTRAGADYGFGLLWVLILAHLLKYPFFEFGPRYVAATGKDLLEGYFKLGKASLVVYAIITFASMFTIQTAVTIVTAGLAVQLFGFSSNIVVWCVIITLASACLLKIGRYGFLDRLMRIIILVLTVSTISALMLSAPSNNIEIDWSQVFPNSAIGITFLLALMGWMPAPIDISVWHSLWALEKRKIKADFTAKQTLLDFRIGYIGAFVLGICFLSLGALIMFGSNQSFSSSGSEFASQLITMYTTNLGSWSNVIIGTAAFTTMFSTTLTTLDASPRSMAKTMKLLYPNQRHFDYTFWLLLLVAGTLVILLFFTSEMGVLIQVATVLSFLTAPFYAILNLKAITAAEVPKRFRPNLGLRLLSYAGILFLVGFGLFYIWSQLGISS